MLTLFPAAPTCQLADIQSMSQDILGEYDSSGILTDVTILNEDGICDRLLQEFHRFDEDLSANGKWQGGSVTGICRGWGTNKFASLESIYQISDTALSAEKQLDDCVNEMVDTFNDSPETFYPIDLSCVSDVFATTTGLLPFWNTFMMFDIRNKFGW